MTVNDDRYASARYAGADRDPSHLDVDFHTNGRVVFTAHDGEDSMNGARHARVVLNVRQRQALAGLLLENMPKGKVR